MSLGRDRRTGGERGVSSDSLRTELKRWNVVEDGVEEADGAAGVADGLLGVPHRGAHLEKGRRGRPAHEV